LPSSLTSDHPRACGFAPHPPVSGCVRCPTALPAPLFSADGPALRPPCPQGRLRPPGRPAGPRPFHSPARQSASRPGAVRQPVGRPGLSTGFPFARTSAEAALRPAYPGADEPASGTLGLSAGEIRTPLRCYSYRHSHSTGVHGTVPRPLLPPADAPLPRTRVPPDPAAASVDRLAPSMLGAGQLRPVSYYALFQGWLILSQPPGCLRRPPSFPTQRSLRDLSGRSGLLPSRPWSLSPTV